MIEAFIFDMDGLLIDSEPLWQKAEVLTFNDYGVPVDLAMTTQTTGLRTDEVVKYWAKRYPGKLDNTQEVASKIDSHVLKLIKTSGEPMPGVIEAIDACVATRLPVAIASSSSMVLIEAVADKLGITSKLTAIHSAHDESHGKPHPAVYISTAKTLGVAPEHCVAFEDSANGVLAAKAAKMLCVAVPEAHLRGDKRFGIADFVLGSLLDFTPEMLQTEHAA